MVVGDFPAKDKIAVITGGGSGIGFALTQLLAAQGAKVLIGDLKLTSDAETFVKGNKNVRFTECDVTEWKQLENLIPTSEREFGDVPDIYVPAAGIFEPTWSNFWDDTEQSRYAQVDINVSHPIKLTRIAIRALLRKNKKGVIACIASSAGLYGFYAASLYCATKHAIVGFVKSMGPADVDEDVKIVGICPGVVMTPLWTDRPDSSEKMAEYQVEDNPHLTPQEVAQAMLDLIQQSKYSGGTVLHLEAGTKEVVFPGVLETEIDAAPDNGRSGVFSRSKQPVVELLKKERGGG